MTMIAEQLEILKAYSEGKAIQSSKKTEENWKDVKDSFWNFKDYKYRIKPEAEYRAYKTNEEMFDDYCERFGVTRKKYEIPLIWVLYENKEPQLITWYAKEPTQRLRNFFAEYTYLDGTPIGKRIKKK